MGEHHHQLPPDPLQAVGGDVPGGTGTGGSVLGGGVPVEIDEAPAGHLGDNLLVHPPVIAVDAAAGEAVQLGINAGDLIDPLVEGAELVQKRLHRGVYLFVVVGPAVHGQGVARRRHGAHPLLVGLARLALPHHEEGGLDAVALQNFQHPAGVGGGAVVKGEAAHLSPAHRLPRPLRGVEVGVEPGIFRGRAVGGGDGILLQQADGAAGLVQLPPQPLQLGLGGGKLGLGLLQAGPLGVQLPRQLLGVPPLAVQRGAAQGQPDAQRRQRPGQRRDRPEQGPAHPLGGGGLRAVLQAVRGREEPLRLC